MSRYPTGSLSERFWMKVKKGGQNDCWPWLGCLTRLGYALIKEEPPSDKMRSAHRLSYELEYGAIPSGDGYHGTCVLHRCDNRSCMNPDHLFLGTHLDNMRDKTAKRRCSVSGPTRRGEYHPSAKLTNAQNLEIIASNESQASLAKRFGVSPSHICRLKNGKAGPYGSRYGYPPALPMP